MSIQLRTEVVTMALDCYRNQVMSGPGVYRLRAA